MIILMKERMTFSLSPESIKTIQNYKKKAGISTNSQVIEEALRSLEQQSLYDMFGEMGQEQDSDELVALSKAAAESFLDDAW